MTQHALWTSRADVAGRWQHAFPRGQWRTGSRDRSLSGTGDVVWLDLTAMPEPQREREIAALGARAVVVALDAQPSAERARWALRAGARGYCHALAAPEQMRRVARVVEDGGLWPGRELVCRIAAALSGRSAADGRLERLGGLERQIVEKVAQGAGNSEVAEALDVTEGKVRFHLAAALERTRARSRIQLALRYHP